MRFATTLLGGALILAFASPGQAARLTLDQVLAAAEAPHPELDAEIARRDLAAAEARLADSRLDVTVQLEGILRGGSNSVDHDFSADNSARLTVRKTLLDFGRSDGASQAAHEEVRAQEHSLVDARSRRRLELMARYFDVLLADLRYAADNEFSAVAYVQWDDLQDRHELGQISNVELAEAESRFQSLREKRNDTLARARASRQRLAIAMNQPDSLAAELEDPRLQGNNRPLPEFEALLPLMLDANPRLRAQASRLEASRTRMQAVRADQNPELAAELGAGAYSRESSTRDNAWAGLVFTWPIHQGRRVDSRLEREQAEYRRLQAEADRLALELRQALLDTWLEIQQLQQSARPAAEKNVVHRDWALEKARAEYELELKTNLGNSMAETQMARLQKRAVEYRLALAWARLEALLGRPLPDTKKPEVKP